ncbi:MULTISPECIES: twin transmembrane helix small protein [unclassified Thalassospira]|jgi:hypothetical protein|uniref:twin transmembrane helix small protein n=1 Tax=unclassified Thalassospira TaxID=2648997 RepID=UPI000A1E3BF1|nr:twin transmembrane helix small protein [Thalassospira sp. MCCC 1A01428]OSQ46338.1 hypothetical protein THS27_00425 [Thalassospira sp. MCCC 1A01428]
MAAFLQIGVLLAMAAVGIILVLGIITMARGKSARTSNKLMQWRIIAQAGAILLLLILSVMAMGHH